MNTLIEKITKQQQCPSKVFLFKEGLFYKAYNQGAYLMRHKNYKVSVKKIKNIENEVVSIGFPSTVFEALKYDFAIQDYLFLGAYIKTYRTYIGNNTKTKFKALVLEYANYFEKKTLPIATISKFRDSVNSYLGIMKHHKTFNLKLKTLFKKQPNLIYNYGYFYIKS